MTLYTFHWNTEHTRLVRVVSCTFVRSRNISVHKKCHAEVNYLDYHTNKFILKLLQCYLITNNVMTLKYSYSYEFWKSSCRLYIDQNYLPKSAEDDIFEWHQFAPEKMHQQTSHLVVQARTPRGPSVRRSSALWHHQDSCTGSNP